MTKMDEKTKDESRFQVSKMTIQILLFIVIFSSFYTFYYYNLRIVVRQRSTKKPEYLGTLINGYRFVVFWFLGCFLRTNEAEGYEGKPIALPSSQGWRR